MLPLWFGGTVSPAVIVAVPVMLGLALLLLFRDPQPMRAAGLVAAISAAFVVPAALVVAPELDPSVAQPIGRGGARPPSAGSG